MDPGPHSTLSLHLSLTTGVPVLVLLLLCSAFISGAEVALFSLHEEDFDVISRRSRRRGRIIRRLLDKPKRLLATLAVANTFTNITIIALFFGISEGLYGGIGIPWLSFMLKLATVAFFILVFGEVMPKIYASRHPALFALRMAHVLNVLSFLLAPLSIPLRELSVIMNRKFGARADELSVDRLSQALELTEYGNANSEEQRLLEGIVTFGNTEARQVMTPRIDVFALAEGEPFSTVIQRITERGFSRIPVYRGDIDTIAGVLYVKDLIPHLDEEDGFNWVKLLREPFYVPESKKLDDLLREFQDMKNHLAIVVDEYGDTAGIISLEDILEEIVGDISDEFDDEDIIYSCIDENNFLFDGKTGLKDFYRITNVEDEPFEQAKGEAESLGGFIMELTGDFPEKGQKINFNGNIFTVESVDKGRIRQIKFTVAP